MLYGALADVVVVAHFGFIAFVALGSILAWRWRSLFWFHLPAVGWAIGIVAVGFTCPLTTIENGLRRVAGESASTEGFIDRYIEGVIYPEQYTSLARALIVVAIVTGWVGLARRRPRSPLRTAPT